jgi:L-gulonolactone oxidase
MKRYKFSNWAETYSCFPERFFQPTSELEIADVLKKARNCGKSVRVIGSGHSPSDIACTSGYMINLDLFNRILHVHLL